MHGVSTRLANVVVIALIAVTKTQEIDCGVAEEGQGYNVDFEIPTGILGDEEIHIEADRQRIAKCKLHTQTCITLQSDLYETSLKHSEGRSFVNLLVYNMTKTIVRDKDNVQFTSTLASDYERRAICKPIIVSRPRDIKCQNKITEEGLYLTCSTQRIYPRGKCLFLVNFNKTTINTHSTSENFEKLAGTPTYFTFSCTLFIPRSRLEPAMYYFNLTMYPSIYNNNTDLLYGANFSVSILLDCPKLVLENCPEYIEESVEVQCTCSNRNTNPTDVSIKWHSKDGSAVPHSIQSNVLHIKAKSASQDIYCEATNVLGWKTYSAPYKLKRRYPVSVKNFTANGTTKLTYAVHKRTVVSLQCDVEGDPFPKLNILNGPTSLSQHQANTSPFSLTLLYNLTCESYSLFTCLAVQGNRQHNKSVTVLCECALQIKVEPSKEHWIKAQTNSYISIVFEIFGHPRPRRYIIIHGVFKFVFENVTNGNSENYGYIIGYQETTAPYGILNFTFAISDQKDLTNYVFIVENGISPALYYTLNITDVYTSEDNTAVDSSGVTTAVALLIPIFIVVIVVCALMWLRKRKVGSANLENTLSLGTHFYEELPYGADDLKSSLDQKASIQARSIEVNHEYSDCDGYLELVSYSPHNSYSPQNIEHYDKVLVYEVK